MHLTLDTVWCLALDADDTVVLRRYRIVWS
jgi:hypothetical protein